MLEKIDKIIERHPGKILTALLTAGALSYFGPMREGCETYQGFTTASDGTVTIIFDPQAVDEGAMPRRTIAPRYGMKAPAELTKTILSVDKKGRWFCFRYRNPINPFFDERFVWGYESPLQLREAVANENSH